jgi:hypothetical protein
MHCCFVRTLLTKWAGTRHRAYLWTPCPYQLAVFRICEGGYPVEVQGMRHLEMAAIKKTSIVGAIDDEKLHAGMSQAA